MRYQHWISRKTGSEARNNTKRVKKALEGGPLRVESSIASQAEDAIKIPIKRMLRLKCHIAALALQGTGHMEYMKAKKPKIEAAP
jgi:hypothetical protein